MSEATMLGAGLTLALGMSVSVVGATIDARTGHVPNWLTLGALCAAPPLAFALETSAHGVQAGLAAAGMSLLGALVCGIGPFILFARGGIGGGDVKLLAAIGAILGFRLGLESEYYGFVLAALYVPAKLAWQGRLLATVIGGFRALLNPLRKKEARVEVPEGLKMRFRFGPAIALGTICAIVLTWMGA